ncbi:MAG: ABC transporter ATP-binding protein [Halalkalicoccus sp.]
MNTENAEHRTERDDADRENLLSVEELRTHIHTSEGVVRAVDGVSFTVERGEVVSLVGESGSGKSVTCRSLTGLVPRPPAEVVGGTVEFDGRSLLEADESALRAIRGDRIAHVFQNPQSALDPVYTVGEQIAEAIEIHRNVAAANARERAIDLLGRVGVPRPAAAVDDYPHEFSGGQRQRVAIAIALAGDPELLIADEPTTAVDVTVQARLIELIDRLVEDELALLMVTHDLRVVAALADRVLVMYGGTIVERGPVDKVFASPAHPYTQALFESYGDGASGAPRAARNEIPAGGCRFRAECPHAVESCGGAAQPEFYPVDRRGHRVSCVHYGPDGDPAPIVENARERGLGGSDE